MTKAELLEQIQSSWDTLHSAIRQLSETQLTSVRSADGWAVKDHLAHLAVWERSALAIIRGEPRHQVLGVDEATYARGDYDHMNATIYARNRERALPEILADWRAIHHQLLTALEALTDADLLRPDTDFLPDESGGPLFTRIVGNTVEHYSEHLTWFSSLSSNA